MRICWFMVLLFGTSCLAQEPKSVPSLKLKVQPGTTVLPQPIIPASLKTMDRMTQVKTHLENYHAACASFVERMARTPEEEKAALLAKTPPVLTTVHLLCQLVQANPGDDASMEALVFLARVADIPKVAKMLASLPRQNSDDTATSIKPLELILKHHANHTKTAEFILKTTLTPELSEFTRAVFAKTTNPEVRGKAGYRLASETLREGDEKAAEPLLESLARDRYLEGVYASGRTLSVSAWADGKLREIRMLKVGKVIPEVYAETLEGKKQTISEFRGKVVVVDVWTTWCGPCKAMIPHQREMIKKLQGRPFELLSVSCDEEKNTLTEFLQKNEMGWKHWWAGRGGEFSKMLNISFYPTIYVIDAKGTIRYKNIRGEELEKAIETLLQEVK
jgi:thiol-disulfide isomerase/thioredoxin